MTTPREPIFLTAEWRDLVMVNFEIEPEILAPRVPAGCELDFHDGRTFVSLVAFKFLKTRVWGLPIPWHRHFEEVNLRFYVRAKVDGTWRRGVVFVKEIVPRWAIAFAARTFYQENYVSLPMRHSGDTSEPGSCLLEYAWRRRGTWEQVKASIEGTAQTPESGSEPSFIAEHYWGYCSQRNGSTVEYQVEHPPWRIWPVESWSMNLETASLYGAEFVETMQDRFSSAFVADGSPVTVRRGRRLCAETVA